jgi:dihydrodipicolinate synthase/N-acetylneuraminate lyase
MPPISQDAELVSKFSHKRFHGIVVPMVTPATNNGHVDADSTVRLIESIVAAKTFLFLFGTSGEASSISKEEKIRTASIACPQFTERTDVYMGISSNCFEESVDLAKAFADLGAHVAVATLPSYLSLNPDQMLKYFEHLADSIPLPLIIYNIPVTTHMSIPLDVVEALSHHPNIVGLKDSERDLERLKSAATQYKDRTDFSHLTGWAPQAVNALQWGSDGLVPVTANLVPHLYLELYNAVIENDLETANRLLEKTNEISKLYQGNRSLGDSLAACKALLNNSGLCGTGMFPPLSAITEEDQERLNNQWAGI